MPPGVPSGGELVIFCGINGRVRCDDHFRSNCLKKSPHVLNQALPACRGAASAEQLGNGPASEIVRVRHGLGSESMDGTIAVSIQMSERSVRVAKIDDAARLDTTPNGHNQAVPGA
jgi:hypothetical protein